MSRQADFDRALERRCEDCEAHKFEADFRAMQSDAEGLLVDAHNLLCKLAGTEFAITERIALDKTIDEFGCKHIRGERQVSVDRVSALAGAR